MGKARVFLGRISYSARHRDIEDFFRGYGRINDVKLKTGFAFIEFDRSRDAEDAVRDLDGRSMLGERVTVEIATGRPRGGNGNRLAVDRSPLRASRPSRRSRSRTWSRTPSRSRSHKKRTRSRRSSSRSSSRSRFRSRKRSSRSLTRSRSRSRSRSHNKRTASRSVSRSRSRSRSRSHKKETKQRKDRKRSRSRSTDRHRKGSSRSEERSRKRNRSSSSTRRSRSDSRAKSRSATRSPPAKRQQRRSSSREHSNNSRPELESSSPVNRSPTLDERKETKEEETRKRSDESKQAATIDISGSEEPSDNEEDEDDEISESSSLYRSTSLSPTGSQKMENEEESDQEDNDSRESDNPENKDGKVTLMDLPDELFLEIIRVGNLGKGLKLRLNKKLEQRVHDHLNFQSLTLSVSAAQCRFTMRDTKKEWTMVFKNEIGSPLDELAWGLNRWSNNTYVPMLVLTVLEPFGERSGKAIKGFCQFNADQLIAISDNPVDLHSLDFTSLLVMSANIRAVSIDHFCNSLQGMDLCIFWKFLVDGASKLESFSILVRKDVGKDFIKAAFDITIEDEDYFQPAIIYLCPPKLHPFQLYSTELYPSNQVHFTDNLQTIVDEHRISFKRITAEQKTNLIKGLHEIKLNQTYSKPLY